MPLPPKNILSPWKRHEQTWKGCTACNLCTRRRNVVLARGQIPCDVLFLGEAPGPSEDVLGKPFAGPAGHLLDKMIVDAITGPHGWKRKPRIAFTNLIACIPLADDNRKFSEPPEDSILACKDRLFEFVDKVAKPKLIVCVGEHAKKWLDTVIPHREAYRADIIHPAAILRTDPDRRNLAIQRTLVTLCDAEKKCFV